MAILKYIILILLLLTNSYIGVLIASKYQNRVRELKELKTSLAIFATKIKLTYEPIPKIFEELGNLKKNNISNVFKKAFQKMAELPAGEAWTEALKIENTNLTKEDIEVLNKLGNLLGKIDIEGQINEIELVNHFLDKQIEIAEEESRKNGKMYKTLGITVGLAIVIVLV